MDIDPLNDAKIVESWSVNARPWVAAVRDGQIESRRQVTDAAIVNAVLSYSPRTVLDIGCGEGWLARELAARNIHAIGIDAIPQLVDAARQAGGGDFHVVSYEEIAAKDFGVSIDAVVCNFSLLGKESVEVVLSAVPSLMNTAGVLIVQTLHPVTACGDLPYRDGWREGSWAGFGPDFSNPAPWYFRTLGRWTQLLRDHGFRLLEVREPIHPKTQKPASVIFVAESRAND